MPTLPLDIPHTFAALAKSAMSNLDDNFAFVSPYQLIYPSGTDDTAAINAVLALGTSVILGPGNFIISGQLAITASGQRVVGLGPQMTTLTCTGSFDIFAFSGGGQGGGVENLSVEASAMTGGNVFNINNYNRSLFNNLIILDAFDVATITHQNVTAFANMWCNNVRGTYGINWACTDTTRGDLLRLFNVTISGNASALPTGIFMDGFCNTLEIQSFAGISLGRGLHVRNTGGGSHTPLFVFADDFETDFPQNEVVRVDVGGHLYFTNCYMHGSKAADGVFIANGSGPVHISNTKITSHFNHGINHDGSDLHVTSCWIEANGQSASNTFDGIFCQGSSVGTSVVGGIVGGSQQQYGVATVVGAQNITISGVDLTGNVTGAYLDATGIGNNNFFAVGAPGSTESILSNVKIGTAGGSTPYVKSYSPAAANPNMNVWAQGTGNVFLRNDPGIALQASTSSGTVNFVQVTASVSGSPVTVFPAGVSGDCSVLIQGKGNGTFIAAQAGTNLGFYGSKGGLKPTITGGAGGTPAVVALLSSLANLGLIINNSTS